MNDPRPEFATKAASVPERQINHKHSGTTRQSRKEKQMKKLQTNDLGIAAEQQFKSVTSISIPRKGRIPMNRYNRGIILSLAAVVLAGLALAAPRAATAQYAF